MFSRKPIRQSLVALAILVGLLSFVSSAGAAASLELYGTFHSMGVIVTMDATDDPNSNATATVEYRTGGGAYQTGFPLSRIDTDLFVGSLFWLTPGTAYDVRVSLTDPDGAPLNGVVLQGTMSTRAEIVIPSPVDSFYVDPNGTGTTCSLAAPCSLTEGINQAGPGDEVVLRGGTYLANDIALPRSGQSGAPIVIRGHTGENAVLDGAYQQSFSWTAVGGGVYSTTVDADNIHLVMADGKRLFPYTGLASLTALDRDNTPGHFQETTPTSNTLYVHLENDKDPNTSTMIVSRYNLAFYVQQDFIYFLDLTFTHYGQGDWAKAIYMNNASDNLVQNCKFTDNDLGVGIKRVSHRNVIQDSVFSDTIADWAWDDIKDVDRLEDGGITFYNPVDGRGNIIRRNTVHDDFDGIGACPGASSALTNETDVYDNVVYNMGDDALTTDGHCRNVRIWGNTFHDILVGISLAPVYDGPVYAIRNLIYRTGVGNNSYTGTPFKFNSGYPNSGPMYLFHNTADAVLPGNNGLHIKTPGTWRLIYSRNNIWAGTDYAINNYNASQPADMDYDNLYNAGANYLVRWDGVRYSDLAGFSATVKQEANGLSVDPGFLHVSNGIYSLGPNSDLVDAGVLIPGINHDYSGSDPDIGAFESGSGNQAPVAVNDTAVVDQDTAITINIITNDQDAEGHPIAIHTFDTASANGGTVSQQDGQHVTYTPASGYTGTDHFTYAATDGQDVSNTATVTITIQATGTTNPGGGNTNGGGDSGGGGGCFLRSLWR